MVSFSYKFHRYRTVLDRHVGCCKFIVNVSIAGFAFMDLCRDLGISFFRVLRFDVILDGIVYLNSCVPVLDK